jgi:16S rRNA U516 pseudouridylate synthase RsuA-like enzyme
MRLKRIQIGPITAPDLKPGQFRQLTPKEIKILKQLKQQKQKYERNGV